MIFLYAASILLCILALISFVVFCLIFMPRKSLIFKNKEKAIKYESVITDKERDEYFATYKKIIIREHEGVRLSGYFYSQEDISNWIIFLHGYRSRSTSMIKYMEYFRKARGYNLLTIDLRGHGERNKMFFSCGSIADVADVMKWVNWIKTKDEHAHIFLFGVSIGGATAINTAGINNSSIDGIIADSSPSSFKRIIEREIYYRCGFLSKYIVSMVALYTYILLKFKIEDADAERHSPNIRCPVLLIHGSDDGFVPVEMMYELYSTLSVKNKFYLEVSGAEHTHAVDVDPQRYWDTINAFFEKVCFPDQH